MQLQVLRSSYGIDSVLRFVAVPCVVAWVQIREGTAAVRAVFKTGNDFVHAGAVKAKSGCWSMLKGGLSVEASGPAELYFEVITIS